MSKIDAYRTRYAKINEVDFEAAWRVVCGTEGTMIEGEWLEHGR